MDKLARRIRGGASALAPVTQASAVVPILQEVQGMVSMIVADRQDSRRHRLAQDKIRSYTTIALEQIQLVRDTWQRGMDQSFATRHVAVERLLDATVSALDRGDVASAGLAIDGVVRIATASPFDGLAEVTTARAALEDPTRDWTL